jgi:hypothetical protein
VKTGKKRHQRAAQHGGQDLRLVRLRCRHDLLDCGALEELTGEEDASPRVDGGRDVRDVADGDADGGEEASCHERPARSDLVLEVAAYDGADGGAEGGGQVPEREPQRREDPFAGILGTVVFSGWSWAVFLYTIAYSHSVET